MWPTAGLASAPFSPELVLTDNGDGGDGGGDGGDGGGGLARRGPQSAQSEPYAQ
jgi:hypothetical protein